MQLPALTSASDICSTSVYYTTTVEQEPHPATKMTAEKRKLAAMANPYEIKRMSLRPTPAHTEHNMKRQRTPNRKRPNAFFEHLPLDVRRIIYDYMILPPFEEAQECAGLYLSCRQAKTEIDQAAPARLRAHLLEFQRDLAQTSKGPGESSAAQRIRNWLYSNRYGPGHWCNYSPIHQRPP
jgi:hypothetical protein